VHDLEVLVLSYYVVIKDHCANLQNNANTIDWTDAYHASLFLVSPEKQPPDITLCILR